MNLSACQPRAFHPQTSEKGPNVRREIQRQVSMQAAKLNHLVGRGLKLQNEVSREGGSQRQGGLLTVGGPAPLLKKLKDGREFKSFERRL